MGKNIINPHPPFSQPLRRYKLVNPTVLETISSATKDLQRQQATAPLPENGQTVREGNIFG
jgi:hypothetical protein